MHASIYRQVLATIAPVITVVGLLQPLNSYVFIGDGILQGSQDFVYEVREEHIRTQPALPPCGPVYPPPLPRLALVLPPSVGSSMVVLLSVRSVS